MRDAWRLAMGTFLAVPVAAPRRVDRRVAGTAMLLAPATALLPGSLWAALGALAVTGWLPATVAAALALVAGALLSRAMHLDGLADLADGLTSGHDPARSLEVMRRGDTGPAGAAALVLSLLVQATALTALLDSRSGVALAVAALVGSRTAAAVTCRRGQAAARPEGLGATVVGTVSPGGLATTLVVVALTATFASWSIGTMPYAAGLVTLAAAVGAWLVGSRAARRLGGVTGDVIGAAIEVALTTSLVVASVLVHRG